MQSGDQLARPPDALIVTVDVGGLLQFLFLPNTNIPDDEAEEIGLSRVAYISKRDKLRIFLPAAKWHDYAYLKGASIQETWQRWEVDLEFLDKMLRIAQGDLELERGAILLWLLVRKYGAKAYEGVPDYAKKAKSLTGQRRQRRTAKKISQPRKKKQKK